MITLIVLASVIAAIGIGLAIWKNKELPESISAMVYDLPRKYQWIWSAWLIVISGLFFPAITATAGGLGWLTEVCLMGAALTPLINKEMLRWHYVCAIVTGVISQVCVVMLDAMWLGVWMLFVFLFLSSYVQPEGWLGKMTKGKGMFLAQMACFIGLVGSLLS